MGVSKSEKGVVKLVHPGRQVEIHTQPITAAEVMSKNPRHCIARPDVFHYPWVVVRPQSILLPGEVFYVVPYQTISDLLKAYNSQTEPNQHYGRSTPMRQQHDRWLVNPFKSPHNRCLVNPFKKAQVNSLPKVTYMNRYMQQERDSEIHAREGSESAKPENGDRHEKSSERVVELKYCMRKSGSACKTRNLKVSFALTTNVTTSRIEAEPPTQCVGCTG